MQKIFIFIICFIWVGNLFGQVKHDFQWVLDHYNLLDFRQNNLEFSILPHSINHGSGDYCTSISSKEGELLFYSGACHILNKENEIMENGDTINSEYAYIDFCGFGDFPMRQNNTIVPFPQQEEKYIYFNLDINIINNDILPSPLRVCLKIKLYYFI